MREDEYNLLIGKFEEQNIPKKRMEYLISKWERKGWCAGKTLTDKFYYVQELALNKRKYMLKYEKHVVVARFIGSPQAIGILENHGDNGWHLFTKKLIKFDMSQSFNFEDIAYIELHPSPEKIWRKMNYLFWRFHRFPDRFHSKISIMDSDTISKYEVIDGKWKVTYTNPFGIVGECYPDCQCKTLTNK